MKEEWREIKGFDRMYEVSNHGRVKSFRFGRERILKPGSVCGYNVVVLTNKKKTKMKYIHRLVAIAFLDRKHSHIVNHIDGNRKNNLVENLEWVTPRENSSVKFREFKRPKSSSYLGVTKCNYKHDRIYKSQIVIYNNIIYLGTFCDEITAHEFYKLALENMKLFDGNKQEFRRIITEMYYG